MRRPVVAAVAVGRAAARPGVAGRSASGSGQTDFTSFPDSLDGVQAVNLLNEKWPRAATLELEVVVTERRRAGDEGRAS